MAVSILCSCPMHCQANKVETHGDNEVDDGGDDNDADDGNDDENNDDKCKQNRSA